MGIIKTIKRKSIRINNYFQKRFILKNKKIIITGSNTGIGLELTKKLILDNNILAIVHKDFNEVKKFENEKLIIFQENFEKNNFEKKLEEEIIKFKPNIIVNCAASFGPERQNINDIEVLKFNELLNINFFAPMKIIQIGLLSGYLEQIANITSEMGSIKLNNHGGYYYYRISKTMLNSFSKNLSIELKNKNINVFSIHPGSVKTKMNSGGLISAEYSSQKIINILYENSSNYSGKLININKKVLQW